MQPELQINNNQTNKRVMPTRVPISRQTKLAFQKGSKFQQTKPSVNKKDSEIHPINPTIIQNPGNTDPYELIKIKENETNDQIVCDICLEDDDFEGDEIVICELCSAATHQTCYGGDIKDRLPLPEQPWYCARCQDLLVSKDKKCTDIKCVLCPQIQGIMKPISEDRKQWAHLMCVNWTPEIWFIDESKSAINGTVQAQRCKLNCGFCRKKEGSCIQCDYRDCSKSWHVKCAARSGIIKPWNKMLSELGSVESSAEMPLFCKEHSQIGKSSYKQKKVEFKMEKSVNRRVRAALQLKQKKVSETSKQAKVIKASKTSNMIKKQTRANRSSVSKMNSIQKQKNTNQQVPQQYTAVNTTANYIYQPQGAEQFQPVLNVEAKVVSQKEYSKLLNEDPQMANQIFQQLLISRQQPAQIQYPQQQSNMSLMPSQNYQQSGMNMQQGMTMVQSQFNQMPYQQLNHFNTQGNQQMQYPQHEMNQHQQ